MAEVTNPQIDIKSTIQTIAVMLIYRREGAFPNRRGCPKLGVGILTMYDERKTGLPGGAQVLGPEGVGYCGG